MNNRNPAIITANNEDLEVTEDKIVFPPWSDIPSPVVENIYSFLNRTDQISMSLVCRNWREEYSSPRLWGNVLFRLLDIEDSTELCPEVIFARRYGSMFRHVEIDFSVSWDTEELLLADAVLNQLILFLEAVTCRSKLFSISFTFIFFSSRRSSGQQYLSDAFEKILNLLKSQKKLQRVQFIHSEFGKEEAANILNAIFANNSKTLKHLVLDKFVGELNYGELKSTISDDLNYMVLMNLENLAIDYSPMFENMILSFYEMRNRIHISERKRRLKKIILTCYGFDDEKSIRIQPSVWANLRNFFPDLRIELVLIFSIGKAILSTDIVHLMPLRALRLVCSSEVQVIQIRTLFLHITSCNNNESIEELLIFYGGSFRKFSLDLISFIHVCPRLKTLELITDYPVAALDAMFHSLLENTPVSLCAVKITVIGVLTEEEKTVYSNLIDLYTPLLQPLELSFSFGNHYTVTTFASWLFNLHRIK